MRHMIILQAFVLSLICQLGAMEPGRVVSLQIERLAGFGGVESTKTRFEFDLGAPQPAIKKVTHYWGGVFRGEQRWLVTTVCDSVGFSATVVDQINQLGIAIEDARRNPPERPKRVLVDQARIVLRVEFERGGANLTVGSVDDLSGPMRNLAKAVVGVCPNTQIDPYLIVLLSGDELTPVIPPPPSK